ncbi:hypothetical protein [Maritalea sp. S77]|uniref:hypothetical protein n=1 Tax=Maritalea sp. S77 TaxID=3415125 RepID=UPI003C7C5F41
MNGLNIFYVAVWRVFANLNVAFRISAFWFGAIILISSATWYVSEFALDMWNKEQHVQLAIQIAPILVGVQLLCAFFGLTVVAVGWHRFSLLNENPNGFVIDLPTGKMKSCLWAAFKFWLAIVLLLIVVAIFSTQLGALVGEFQPVLSFVISILYGVVLVGPAMLLPAASIDQQLGIARMVDIVRQNFGFLLVLSTIYVLFSLGMNFVLNFAENNYLQTSNAVVLILVWLVQTAFRWISVMFGLSYVTELYRSIVLNNVVSTEQVKPSF